MTEFLIELDITLCYKAIFQVFIFIYIYIYTKITINSNDDLPSENDQIYTI